MASCTYRLRLKKDIEAVIGRGRYFQGRVFTLKYLPSTKQNFRFSVVVGSKVSKKAVIRNRIRRRVKSVVWQHVSTLPLFDVLFFAKKGSEKSNFLEIKEDVYFLLNQLTKRARL